MPIVTLSVYKLLEVSNIHSRISFDLSSSIPDRTIDLKTVDDIKRELSKFAEELKETNQSWQIRTTLINGRKPSGFDKARMNDELSVNVNPELVWIDKK